MKCFFCKSEVNEYKLSDPEVYLYDCPWCLKFKISIFDKELIKNHKDFNDENKAIVSKFIHEYNKQHGGKLVRILFSEHSKNPEKKNEYAFDEIVN